MFFTQTTNYLANKIRKLHPGHDGKVLLAAAVLTKQRTLLKEVGRIVKRAEITKRKGDESDA